MRLSRFRRRQRFTRLARCQVNWYCQCATAETVSRVNERTANATSVAWSQVRKEMKQMVDDYLRYHGLGPLFESMTAALLLHKPAQPCKFLADYLTGLQSQGAQPALTREELRIMFGMFDVTEKGTVSVAQANQVFVAQMHGALRAAAPTLAEAAK